MMDLDTLRAVIDTLPENELNQIYQYIVQRRQPTYWLIPGENLKTIRDIMRPVYEQNASLTDEEINAAIDDALTEVRVERKTHRLD